MLSFAFATCHLPCPPIISDFLPQSRKQASSLCLHTFVACCNQISSFIGTAMSPSQLLLCSFFHKISLQKILSKRLQTSISQQFLYTGQLKKTKNNGQQNECASSVELGQIVAFQNRKHTGEQERKRKLPNWKVGLY